MDTSEENRGEQSFLKGLLSLVKKEKKPKSTKQEIEKILDAVEERGIIEEDQGDMIHNIIELKETAVREIMVPKVDMVALESTASLDDLVETIITHGCSRIPIYEKTMDNIVGVINAKDVLKYWRQAPQNLDIREMMHKAYFVPEGKKLIDLLNEFKQSRSKMAIVIDEYGNVDGLLTIGDIMEEIVGDIQGEDDELLEHDIEDKGDGSFSVDPKMPIDEFAEAFAVTLPEGGYDTVAGFITFILQRIPEAGETLEYAGLRFEIEQADKRRISKLIVHALPVPLA